MAAISFEGNITKDLKKSSFILFYRFDFSSIESPKENIDKMSIYAIFGKADEIDFL